MAHIHKVYDNDVHFKIDGVTRVVKNVSDTKAMVVQHDHKSERFTFEIPRIIDGHDMSTCNRVQVHFINTDSKNKTLYSTGIYPVGDLQVCPDDEDIVICSWLIDESATKHVGKLEFTIHFACVSDLEIDYAWNTVKFSNVYVAEGIFLGKVNYSPETPVVPCTGITFEKTAMEVKEGRTFAISYTVTPEDCTEEVAWTSSNTDVAQVFHGIVSTIAPGTAVITAVCGEFIATCDLEVTEVTGETGIKCTGITTKSQFVSLTAGFTMPIEFTVTPEDCTERIYWSSSNPAVAVVDNGIVGAIAEGTAVVTATCGDFSASVDVTVNAKPPSLDDGDAYVLTDADKAEIVTQVKDTLTPADIGAMEDGVVTVDKGGTGKTSSAEAFTALARRASIGNSNPSNANTLTTPGIYHVYFEGDALNPADYNYPYAHGVLFVASTAAAYVGQLFYAVSANKLWYRTRAAIGSDWGSWCEVYDTANKPTPADIGAAAYAHSHTASAISGGTFAGKVFANANGQAADTSLLRNSKLVSAEENPTVNGEICWTYK